MAVAYVGELAAGGAVGSDGPTQTITLAAGASQPDLVVLALGYKSLAATAAAVTDSRGNTWRIDVGPHNANNNSALIASTLQDAGALQSGDIITVTLTGGVFSSPVQVGWWVEEFSGVALSSPLDQAALADNGSGLSGSSGTTAATLQADEVAVAFITVGSQETTLTQSSFTAFTTGPRHANGRSNLAVYKILTAAGTQSESFSWSAVADVANGMIAAYRGETAPAQRPPRRMPQGG